MNKKIKWFALFLAGLITLTSLAACAGEDADADDNDDDEEQVEITNDRDDEVDNKDKAENGDAPDTTTGQDDGTNVDDPDTTNGKENEETAPSTTEPSVEDDTPATDGSKGLEFDLNNDGTYSVEGIGDCTDTKIVIPSIYEGKAVTEIEEEAFESCTDITHVTIPDSVKRIGENAFSNCSALTEVIISEGVESIGDDAFGICSALTKITIPASVTSIGEMAFSQCKKLESLDVAEGNTVYHSDGNCLIETASKTLLRGCYTSVIPQDGSVTSIGDYAFFGDDYQLEEIVIPEGVTSIGANAFYFCSALEKVTLPNSLLTIGEGAFSAVPIKEISIPAGVTTIGDGAFSFTHLIDATIPASVTSIEGPLFTACMDLKTITVADGNPVYHSVDNCLIETETKTLIEGCSGSVIPQDGSVTAIGEYAFYGHSALASVTIPEAVTVIDDHTFYECQALTEITIPQNVTTIGKYAFANCTSLTQITIPQNVTTIGKSAFSNCTSLTQITIPAGVTLIESNAFVYCEALTSVVFENPNGWTVNGEPVDVSDPSNMAVDLVENYRFSKLVRS